MCLSVFTFKMESCADNVDTKNNTTLNQTDRDILLSILPSNVWAQTSKILEANHPSSLENLSNSSLYFRNVVLSKRVNFLFPQVFKLIGPQFENQKNTKTEGSNIIKCRIISKSWRKTVDKFIISSTREPDFFNTEPSLPTDHALIKARYQYFGHMAPNKLQKFLEHFHETHLPHSTRNPFIGNVVYIDLTGFFDQTQWASIADQVSTLLRKYGRHIKILNVGLFQFNRDPEFQLQKHSSLSEWLDNCPSLTHLKVSERFSLGDNLDTAFGIRPAPNRLTAFRDMGLQDPSLTGRVTPLNEMWRARQHWLCDYRREDQRDDLNRVFEQELHIVRGLGANYYRQDRPTARPVVQPTVPTFPILKNLQCLKLIFLSALNFNSLISANNRVTWLHIEPLKVDLENYIILPYIRFPKSDKSLLKIVLTKGCQKVKVCSSKLVTINSPALRVLYVRIV